MYGTRRLLRRLLRPPPCGEENCHNVLTQEVLTVSGYCWDKITLTK